MKPQSIIIIGAGLGGIAAGIRLAVDGCKVRIFEKNHFPGGCLGTIRADIQDGSARIGQFRFNYGAEYIAAPFLFDQLFEYAGKRRVDFIRFKDSEPVFQAIFPDSYRFAFYSDPLETEKRNLWLYPQDTIAFRTFSQDNFSLFDELFFDYCSRPVDENFFSLRQNLWLRRHDLHKTGAEYVAEMFWDPNLQRLFGLWPLLGGGDPRKSSHLFRLTAELFHRWGGAVPEHGMDQVVQALVTLFVESGGEIIYNAEVQEIQIFNKTVAGVRLNDGSVQQADIVISDVDAAATYLNLIDSDRTRYRVVEQSKMRKPGFGMFVYHLGTRCILGESTPLAPFNILFPQDYDRFLDELFLQKSLSEDPLVFLRIPSKVHDTVAPEGCEALTAMVPVPNLNEFDNWQQQSYEFRNRLLSRLQTYFHTDIKSNLVVEKYADPGAYQKVVGSYAGAAFSYLPVIQRSGEIRMPNRSRDIRNLYLVGAGSHPGASIPGVLLSAANTAALIRNDFSD